MITYAYERVSTKDQNLERQDIAIKQFRPTITETNIFRDKFTGKSFDRPQYNARVPETAGLYCLLEDYKEKLTLDEYWERIKSAGLEMKLKAKHMEEYNRAYSALNENKELFSKDEIKAVRAKEKERA